jgi:hypothetical protein
MMKRLLLSALVLSLMPHAAKANDDFYAEPPLFHFFPDPKASTNTIGRLGPIGLSLVLHKPAFTMHIGKIEEGSPAAATGKLKSGQIIASINGEVLKDIDPRVQLGNLITKIESTDGEVRLMIKDSEKADAYPVTFKIPVLGPYSATWPVNCPKSDAIVKTMSKQLREAETWGWGASLFLLSTGEKEDLEEVRKRLSGKLGTDKPGFPWSIGYDDMAVCEYYLKTGDQTVLPAIKSKCDYLLDKMYNDSWMGRGGANFGYMGGGHLNAGGLHAVTFLLLAKECGVEVNETLLNRTFRHLYRFAGRGVVAYGDQMPEGGFSDNGKVAKLAFTLQAAANLSPKGEDSVYAKARDISATKSFYSTSWLFHGHTGGGIGELWRGSSMGLVKDKRPDQYRSFMDERRWMYELARTYDGMFGWADGLNVGYTGVNIGKPCGNYIPLIYTLPRKQLRIFGAPATKFSKTYDLPERAWGTAADDVFYSLEPGEYAPGKRLDISKETIRNGASRGIFDRISKPDVTEETLLGYALHIDQTIRVTAMTQITKRGLHHLTMQLLKSKDPRGRHSGLLGVSALPQPMSDEVAGLLAAMISDPEESWWVVMEALKNLEKASADQLAPHVSTIEKWMAHDDWWLQACAIQASSPLVVDPRFHQRLIPKIADIMSKNQRPGLIGAIRKIAQLAQNAPEPVQKFAKEQFAKAYADFPERITAPGRQDMSSGTEYMLRSAAQSVAEIPGGLDALYEVAKLRFPTITLPHKDLYLQADTSRLGPALQKSMKQIILEDLVPEYIGTGTHPQSNRGYLLNEVTSAKPFELGGYYGEPRMLGLVDLYQRAGVHEYEWKDIGPKWDEMTWHYLTFDPPEKKLVGTGTRYRKITMPAGTDEWFKPGFDPEKAGWKSGKQPLGQLNGKLADKLRDCKGDFCRCGQPMHTLWDKEVMLLTGTFRFPKFKEGHLYRLMVGGMSHVNAGDGFRIYVGGREMLVREDGVGKRAGGRPLAFYIDQSWWPEFEKGDTNISAISFLRMDQNTTNRHFSLWLQEMKLPVVTRDDILLSATKVPMSTSEWQTLQNPDTFVDPNEGTFIWDGKFAPNPEVVGSWTQIGSTASIDEYKPGAPAPKNKAPSLGNITFNTDGSTDEELLIWSGATLMNLRKNEAMKITPSKIDGTDYLFIEAGGFHVNKGPDWKSPFHVMKRK